MKDKLTHEIEILGRSVSVLLLIGLIMAAGASAALLDSFGTVEGEADVDQAITIGDETFAEGAAEATFGFDDETTVAGETFVDTQTINNNADVSANYKFVTEGTELGVDSEIYRLETYQESTEGETVVTSYDADEDVVVFNVSNDEEEKVGGIDFDFDKDGKFEVFTNAKFHNFEENNHPQFVVWDNRGSDAVKDVQYQDKDNDDNGLVFDSSTTTGNHPEKLADVFSGTVKEDYFVVKVDADTLGYQYNYRLLSDDDSRKTLNGQIGPKVGTGAANDLEEGTVTRTYQNGEVTFNFSAPESSPVLGIDSNNDGTYDFQFDYNGVAVDYWDHGGDESDLWSYSTEYRAQEEPELDPDNEPSWDNGAPEGVSISGGKHTDYVAITIDSSRLDDTFRYDVGQNGDVFSGKDEGDSSQAEVVTTGVETLDSQESQDYVFVNDFAINLEEDDYTVSTDVVPVTE